MENFDQARLQKLKQPIANANVAPAGGGVNANAANNANLSRRDELLQSARKYRNKFVLSAMNGGVDIQSKLQLTPQSIGAAAAAGAKTKKGKEKDKAKDAPLIQRIPAFDAIDNVLVYLTDIIDDGLSVDAESILADNIDFYEQYNLEGSANNSTSQVDKDPFVIFLDKLRKPAAFDLVKSIQALVLRFEAQRRLGGAGGSSASFSSSSSNVNPSLEKDSHSLSPTSNSLSPENQWAMEIWKFIDKASSQMKDNGLWNLEPPDQFSKSCEHLEKFIFIKLYPMIFPNQTADDKQLNLDSRSRIQNLSFLSPEHLDLKVHKLTKSLVKSFTASSPHSLVGLSFETTSSTSSSNSSSVSSTSNSVNLLFKEILQEPAALIRCLDHCESIIDMIYYLRLASISIARILHILKNGSIETDSSSSSTSPTSTSSTSTSSSFTTPAGADDFLPMMILAVQMADLGKMQSTITYLQTYASPKKLVSETGYLLTQFISAVHFLETVDSSVLTISPDEFDRAFEACKRQSLHGTSIYRLNATDSNPMDGNSNDYNKGYDNNSRNSNSNNDHDNGNKYNNNNNNNNDGIGGGSFSNDKSQKESTLSESEVLAKKIESSKAHIKNLEKMLKLSPLSSTKTVVRPNAPESLNGVSNSKSLYELMKIYDRGASSSQNNLSCSMAIGVRNNTPDRAITTTTTTTTSTSSSHDSGSSVKYSELLLQMERRYLKLQRDHMARPQASSNSSVNSSAHVGGGSDGGGAIDVSSIRGNIQAVSNARLGNLTKSEVQLLIEDYQRLSKVCAVFIHDKFN